MVANYRIYESIWLFCKLEIRGIGNSGLLIVTGVCAVHTRKCISLRIHVLVYAIQRLLTTDPVTLRISGCSVMLSADTIKPNTGQPFTMMNDSSSGIANELSVNTPSLLLISDMGFTTPLI